MAPENNISPGLRGRDRAAQSPKTHFKIMDQHRGRYVRARPELHHERGIAPEKLLLSNCASRPPVKLPAQSGSVPENPTPDELPVSSSVSSAVRAASVSGTGPCARSRIRDSYEEQGASITGREVRRGSSSG